MLLKDEVIQQGWYKAVLVEKEAHLLELCRYIVLNPVRAGMGQALETELVRAERKGNAFSKTLYRLLMEESRYRSEKSMANRLTQAKISC